MKILGTYKIVYAGGIEQIKNLISHDDFINIIKPKKEIIYQLELTKKDKDKDGKIDQVELDKKNKAISAIKSELKGLFGEEWFTDQSPLYDAINTGILSLLPQQGGDQQCNLTLIN